ncbi:MAG: DUF433 domain-containing protein [Deltaproteobacteria bacterium]|nr:DUF433 domain-containing protein [Deltaproteobacteria bacterium]
MGRSFKLVFPIAQASPPSLSFFNLVEAHVLNSMRDYLSLPRIRDALKWVEHGLGVTRPLINKRFQTDGLDLFVEHTDKLLNASRRGQIAMRPVIEEYLKRIEFDSDGLAMRLFPFSRHHRAPEPGAPEDPKAVVFDPRISFGRLTVVGTGIATATIYDRFLAGETIEDIVRDFKMEHRFVEEAIRCESLQKAA